MPITAGGRTYVHTMRSRRSPPTSSATESGYMQMRWYQHSGHGW